MLPDPAGMGLHREQPPNREMVPVQVTDRRAVDMVGVALAVGGGCRWYWCTVGAKVGDHTGAEKPLAWFTPPATGVDKAPSKLGALWYQEER